MQVSIFSKRNHIYHTVMHYNYGLYVTFTPTRIFNVCLRYYRQMTVYFMPLIQKYYHVFHACLYLFFTFTQSNAFFIVAIIWVLVTKMKASNTLETRQSRQVLEKRSRDLLTLAVTLLLVFVFMLKVQSWITGKAIRGVSTQEHTHII